MDMALLTMVSALFVAVLGNTWQLTREIARTRTELRGEMRDLGTELRGEMRDLGTELRGEMKELRSDHSSLRVALAEVRERLSGIEGHLGISFKKKDKEETSD